MAATEGGSEQHTRPASGSPSRRRPGALLFQCVVGEGEPGEGVGAPVRFGAADRVGADPEKVDGFAESQVSLVPAEAIDLDPDGALTVA